MIVRDKPSFLSSGRESAVTTWQWEFVDLDNVEVMEKTRTAAQSLCISDARAALDHDRAWLQGSDASRIYVCKKGSAVVAYAPFAWRKTTINVRVGEIPILALPVERFVFTGCPLVAPELRQDEPGLTRDFLNFIAEALPSAGVVYVAGARADSALFELLSTERTEPLHLYVLPRGTAYQRRLIELPPRFDDYLASLGRKTREDLRRHQRRLAEAADGPVTLRRYERVEDVPLFLDAAMKVSQKTYQWHLLDRGLRDRQGEEQRLKLAAENGWLCCYILYSGDAPIAFMVGFRSRDTYSSEEIGYDPAWQRHSVGNVLHCHVVRDLIDRFKDLRYFDFMHGDSPNKERLSNLSRMERNYFLFPKTLRGLAGYLLIGTADRLSEALARVLEKYKLKSTIRRMVRRTAAKRGTGDIPDKEPV